MVEKVVEDFIKYTALLKKNIQHFNKLEQTKQKYKQMYRQNPNDKKLLKKIKLLQRDYETTLEESQLLQKQVEQFQKHNGKK